MRYNTSESLDQVLSRRDRLRKKREQRRLTFFSLGVCAILLVLTLTATLRSGAVIGPQGEGAASMGSFLLEGNTGGFVAGIVLALLVGVLITLLCIRQKQAKANARQSAEKEPKQEPRQEENGGNEP